MFLVHWPLFEGLIDTQIPVSTSLLILFASNKHAFILYARLLELGLKKGHRRAWSVLNGPRL